METMGMTERLQLSDQDRARIEAEEKKEYLRQKAELDSERRRAQASAEYRDAQRLACYARAETDEIEANLLVEEASAAEEAGDLRLHKAKLAVAAEKFRQAGAEYDTVRFAKRAGQMRHLAKNGGDYAELATWRG
jgi:hypothetical protein